MNGRLSYITLPSTDLESATAFYETVFQWPAHKVVQDAHFFELPNLKIALMQTEAFAEFIGTDSLNELTASALCSWNVESREAIDDLVCRAVDLGAITVRQTGELTWGGWAAVIRTDEGHLWEIVWNPKLG